MNPTTSPSRTAPIPSPGRRTPPRRYTSTSPTDGVTTDEAGIGVTVEFTSAGEPPAYDRWNGTGAHHSPGPAQKSNLSMLPASNLVGGPRITSPFAPTVRSPSLPAVNFSPSAPVIRPDASAAAA
jgi:hypothetical protein